MILIHLKTYCAILKAVLSFTAATLPCLLKESVKISSLILPKLIYGFKTITIKTPASLLDDIDNMTLKFT